MNILIIGSGGREHAIAYGIKQSKKVSNLYIAPGNAGTENLGKNISLSINNFDEIKSFCIENKIDLVVVGPEAPLVDGIYDFFKNTVELKNTAIVAPSQQGAMLEGSKEFAKLFMNKYNIPTAKHFTATSKNIDEANTVLDSLNPPYVLKADGLAAGKGVLILDSLAQAKEELKKIVLDNKFGKAGSKVVIEEFLNGIELSVFVLTDGKNYKILPTSKDYKRIGEGDKGLNTGGMGAVSPVSFADKSFMQKVEEQIVKPTIKGLSEDNIAYQGIIYLGLMNVNGNPFVIEYNVRFGDPEAEVVIPRIQTDWVDIFMAISNQTLSKISLQINTKPAVTVVLASHGYPESYDKGNVISGLDTELENSIVFYAGVKKEDNLLKTNGGRVLSITAFGDSIEEALKNSYAHIQNISFEKMYYRKDIGYEFI